MGDSDRARADLLREDHERLLFGALRSILAAKTLDEAKRIARAAIGGEASARWLISRRGRPPD